MNHGRESAPSSDQSGTTSGHHRPYLRSPGPEGVGHDHLEEQPSRSPTAPTPSPSSPGGTEPVQQPRGEQSKGT